MTDWIDFAIYVVFLVGLWFVNPTTQQRLAIPMLMDRNAEWMMAHPDFVVRLRKRRWNLWLNYALGAASIAVLASLQFGLWVPEGRHGHPAPMRWAVLWELAMASMIVAMVVGGTIGLIGHFRMKKRIPVAPRRQASLKRRSLDESVPRWVQLATYALVFANLAAWITAAVLGAHSSAIFWPRVVILFALSGFFYVGTMASVIRRPNVMDRIFGPAYRQGEVRYVFSMQILPPVVGALRLYEEVADTHLLDLSRMMQLFLAVFILYAFLRVARLRIDEGGSPCGQAAIPGSRLLA